jgi:hypothetical protein
MSCSSLVRIVHGALRRAVATTCASAALAVPVTASRRPATLANSKSAASTKTFLKSRLSRTSCDLSRNVSVTTIAGTKRIASSSSATRNTARIFGSPLLSARTAPESRMNRGGSLVIGRLSDRRLLSPRLQLSEEFFSSGYFIVRRWPILLIQHVQIPSMLLGQTLQHFGRWQRI